jgi:hypothetical protein
MSTYAHRALLMASVSLSILSAATSKSDAQGLGGLFGNIIGQAIQSQQEQLVRQQELAQQRASQRQQRAIQRQQAAAPPPQQHTEDLRMVCPGFVMTFSNNTLTSTSPSKIASYPVIKTEVKDGLTVRASTKWGGHVAVYFSTNNTSRVFWTSAKGEVVVQDCENDEQPQQQASNTDNNRTIDQGRSEAANALQLKSIELQKEQDAARQQKEQEQQRKSQEQQEKVKEQRLEKLVPAAKQLVADVAVLMKADPKSPKLLDYAESIANLNTAIDQGNADEIEHKSSALSTQLRSEPTYQQLEVARAEEQKSLSARYLGDSIKLAQRQRDFILDYISKNPISPNVSKLIPLVKQINPALVTPELSKLQTLTANIDLAIRGSDLIDDFTTTVEGAPTKDSSVNAFKTEKNKFLVEGDLDDVVLLYNTSPHAPHVARNLRGDIVFSDKRADVCSLGNNPDNFALTVRSNLTDFHPRTITGLNQPCDQSHLRSYDIIATQRGAFLKLETVDALSLTKSIEIGEFQKLAVITSAEIRNSDEAEQRNIDEIATDVTNGSANGYGLVLISSGPPNICMAVNDKPNIHARLLLVKADKLNLIMRADPTITSSDAENVFEDIQKTKCGAIYADAANLKNLVSGLNREHISFKFSSIWTTQDEVDAEDKVVAEEHRLERQLATERARKTADSARLEAQREQDQNATNSAKQSALRIKYKEIALASTASIANYIKTFTNKAIAPAGAKVVVAALATEEGAVAVATKVTGKTAISYPEYAGWLREQLSNHWEVLSVDSALEDFGTSHFKGRELDTTFAKITIRLKNRILGEYQDRCFIFGSVMDTEFSMIREPVEATCDDVETLTQWKDGHQFQSNWVVN